MHAMAVSNCCEDLASNRCTPPHSQLPASCVQGRSEMVYGYIKRHTAKIHYNLLPLPFASWNKQPQQRRQRLIPLRRIQSSGESGRSASTTSNSTCAGNAAAQASACTTSGATIARNVAAPAFASTASYAMVAPSVRTSHARLKDAHSSATVFAVPKLC